MSDGDERLDPHRICETVRHGSPAGRVDLASCLARNYAGNQAPLLEALDDPSVRRWARTELLDRLAPDDAAALSRSLLHWRDDFRQERRDRSTSNVVQHLPFDSLLEHAALLASTNAASSLWQRLSEYSEAPVFDAARVIMKSGDTGARETTLHLLVLDPYGPEYLGREQQDELLRLALDDPDDEIRGLAAEVIAADLPQILLVRWDNAMLDAGERVRMAFWRTVFVHEPDRAFEGAATMALDSSAPQEARRTALLALGENVATRIVSPVLEALLESGEEILAEDAAQLMWRYHRAPNVAYAASRSQFESVRTLAERLLHPERGSPAAGGSRPGDPTRTTDIFDQFVSEDDPPDSEREGR